MHKSIIIASIALAAIVGCSSLSVIEDFTTEQLDTIYQEWVESGGLATSISNYLASVEASSSETSEDQDTEGTDAVEFSGFQWIYGGFNGASATHSSSDPVISALSFSSSSCSFNYETDLSAWGLPYTDASGALACLFVKRTDGTWVGGKFDWISSSRTSRGFSGHVPGYSGWSLDGVPNPCEAAFVIVSANGRQRSNVMKGVWTR